MSQFSAPDTAVEETVLKSEGQAEQGPTEAPETTATAPAVAAPDTTTETPTAAPPISTEAASNAEEVPIPSAEEPSVQDVADKTQTSEMDRIEPGGTGMNGY